VRGGIQFSEVRKVYRWRGRRRRGETLKGALFQRGRKSKPPKAEEHLALDGVNLTVEPGEAVAIIGPNGSGKSTFLKLASGILRPTAGEVIVDGRVTALIELGAGFHPEITGRENVLINGMLLGLTRPEVEARMPDIIEFADIGDFIDQPVKTYSSGMYVRLGFAVAVSADPDVLLIDEVLAVGDQAFTRRCLDRLARMRQRGVTMILVSHDLDLVTSFADRALYLEGGRQVAVGPVDSVVARYRSDAAGDAETPQTPAPAVRVLEEGRRWGNGDVEILEVEALAGGSRQRLLPSGGPCRLHIRYRVHRAVEDFVFGVAWHRPDGTLVSGHNTELGGLASRLLAEDGEISCAYNALELAPGEYHLDVAVHTREGLAYDYWCDALRVRVTSDVEWPGVWAPTHHWESSGPDWRSK
jgi:ABC-type polysaccharide/polyol phosphate transport system ATPase subunit